MRRVATALLLLMAGVYVATRVAPPFPAVGYVRAFAEAAMIGALADWFAVTALFRHPLGLPIPHTAIVPKRKDDIGRSLASFVGDHFLIPDVIHTRLANAHLARAAGEWLAKPANADRVAADLAEALAWAARNFEGPELDQWVRRKVEQALDQTQLSQVLGALLEVLSEGSHAQTLIDELVQLGRDQLDGNRERIRRRIQDESPWWLPKFVDEEIYTKLVGELDRIFSEVGSNPEHPARIAFNERLKSFTASLNEDEAFQSKAESIKREIVNHPAVRGYCQDLWVELKAHLIEQLEGDASELRSSIAKQVRKLATELVNDKRTAALIDDRLRQVIVYLVNRYRQNLSSIIADTIASWDAESTSNRIELYIGRDLQFIRINGTLVGGLVGLLLHTASEFIW